MRTTIRIFVVCWLVAGSVAVHAVTFDEAMVAYIGGDYATALAGFRPLAEQGGANAPFFLAFMYENGTGVPENVTEAVKWYGKAAEQGVTGAQTNLGLMYAIGKGVPPNLVYAWLNLAARQGFKLAVEMKEIALNSNSMMPQQIAEAQKLSRQWHAKTQARKK